MSAELEAWRKARLRILEQFQQGKEDKKEELCKFSRGARAIPSLKRARTDRGSAASLPYPSLPRSAPPHLDSAQPLAIFVVHARGTESSS